MHKRILFLLWSTAFLWNCGNEPISTSDNDDKAQKTLLFAKELHERFQLTKEGLPFFKLAQKLDPKSFKTNGDLGVIYLTLNEKQEALKYLTKALKINPTSIETNEHLGNIYFSLDQYGISLKFLEKAEKLINLRIKKFPRTPKFTLDEFSKKLSKIYSIASIAADAISDGKKSIKYTKKAYKEYLNIKDFRNASIAKIQLEKLRLKYIN